MSDKDHSQTKLRPKYTYLDKFERYVWRTDKMLQDLESKQLSQERYIINLESRIKIKQQQTYILFAVFGITLFILGLACLALLT